MGPFCLKGLGTQLRASCSRGEAAFKSHVQILDWLYENKIFNLKWQEHDRTIIVMGLNVLLLNPSWNSSQRWKLSLFVLITFCSASKTLINMWWVSINWWFSWLNAQTWWTSLRYFEQDRSHMIVVDRFIRPRDAKTQMSRHMFGKTNGNNFNVWLSEITLTSTCKLHLQIVTHKFYK